MSVEKMAIGLALDAYGRNIYWLQRAQGLAKAANECLDEADMCLTNMNGVMKKKFTEAGEPFLTTQLGVRALTARNAAFELRAGLERAARIAYGEDLFLAERAAQHEPLEAGRPSLQRLARNKKRRRG
ncbi:hypothetical protein [Actinobaculum suis]|nr:hypothetical protein [Actinobaculum suis]